MGRPTITANVPPLDDGRGTKPDDKGLLAAGPLSFSYPAFEMLAKIREFERDLVKARARVRVNGGLKDE